MGNYAPKTQHFSWVTDFTITKANAYELMRGGSTRWKVENGTFNTLKNQGYHFGHNYGLGKKKLVFWGMALCVPGYHRTQLAFQHFFMKRLPALAIWGVSGGLFSSIEALRHGDFHEKTWALNPAESDELGG